MSPLVAEDNATVNVQGEPEVQVVPVPLTAAYKVPPPVTAIETIAASPTNAPAMAATRATRAVTSPSLPPVRSRDLLGALVACPPLFEAFPRGHLRLTLGCKGAHAVEFKRAISGI